MEKNKRETLRHINLRIKDIDNTISIVSSSIYASYANRLFDKRLVEFEHSYLDKCFQNKTVLTKYSIQLLFKIIQERHC